MRGPGTAAESCALFVVHAAGRVAGLRRRGSHGLLAVGGDEPRASSASGPAGLPGGVYSSVLFDPTVPQPAAGVDQGAATAPGDVRIDAAGESANAGKHPFRLRSLQPRVR